MSQLHLQCLQVTAARSSNMSHVLDFSQNASVTLRAPSAPCVSPVGVSVCVDPMWLAGTVTSVLLLPSSLDQVAAEVRNSSVSDQNFNCSDWIEENPPRSSVLLLTVFFCLLVFFQRVPATLKGPRVHSVIS